MCCAQSSLYLPAGFVSRTVGSARTLPVDTVLISLATSFAGVKVKGPASPPGFGMQISGTNLSAELGALKLVQQFNYVTRMLSTSTFILGDLTVSREVCGEYIEIFRHI